MAEKNNAVCSICGKGYYVCLSCSDAMKLHPFKSFTDTAEHFKIFQIVKGFNTGVYTKDEAREKFQNVDLKDIDSFRPHIKEIIKDILKEPTVEKMAISRKKNYKVEKNEVNEKVENEAINVVKNTVNEVVVDNIEESIEAE